MKTVGSILKEARTSKKLTLEQIEKDTKIRQKFLEAIEADDFSKIPTMSYAKGFVKNYSQYMGLSSDYVLAFFRRQTTDVTRSSLLPKGVSEPLKKTFFRLTPARFLVFIFSLFAVIFLSYFGLQYYKLTTVPKLEIVSPKADFVSTDKRLEIFGKTDPDATILVNGLSTLVRSDGQFFVQITLDPGINTITFIATSRYGKSITLKKEVAYRP